MNSTSLYAPSISINALRAREEPVFCSCSIWKDAISKAGFSLLLCSPSSHFLFLYCFRCKAWWCAILVSPWFCSTLSWFRKRRISDSVAVPPLFMVAIDVLLRAVCARSASTSRCMTASKLFWKVWIFGKTSSRSDCHRSDEEIKVFQRSESRVTSRRIARLSSVMLRFSDEVPKKGEDNSVLNCSKMSQTSNCGWKHGKSWRINVIYCLQIELDEFSTKIWKSRV